MRQVTEGKGQTQRLSLRCKTKSVSTFFSQLGVKSRDFVYWSLAGGQKDMEGFLLVCVFILLVMIVLNRSKQKDERAEDREIIRDLIARIYFLEDTVTKLKREPDRSKNVSQKHRLKLRQRLSQSRTHQFIQLHHRINRRKKLRRPR